MPSKRAIIDATKCDKCTACKVAKICPASAIEREDPEDPYFVNPGCQGCGRCINHCPNQAIQLV